MAEHVDVSKAFAVFKKFFRIELLSIRLIVVFGLASSFSLFVTPFGIQALVNTVVTANVIQPIIIIVLFVFFGLFVANIFRSVQIYIIELMKRRIFSRAATELSHRLPRVEQIALRTENPRELVNRFLEIFTLQTTSGGLLLEGIGLLLQMFIGLVILAFYHPYLLAFDLVLIFCVYIIFFVLGRGAVYSSIVESKKKYEVLALLQEVFSNSSVGQTHAGRRFAVDRIDQKVINYIEARATHFNIMMRQVIGALGLQVVASALLLGIGGFLVLKNQLALGQLVAAEIIVTNLVDSLAKFQKHWESYYDMLAGCDKIGELMDLPLEDVRNRKELDSAENLHVELKNITFKDSTNRIVLDNLDINLTAGKMIGLTGPHGSGKSLVLKVIAGHYKPDSGVVLYNETNSNLIHQDWLSKNITLVRDIEIFDGTIWDNLTLGLSDYDLKTVQNSLDIVLLDDVISSFAKGMNTEISTQGYPLSRGQTYRLCLARALLHKPKMLLLDETIDMVRPQLQHEIMENLKKCHFIETVLVATALDTVLQHVDIKWTLANKKIEVQTVLKK